MCGTFTEKSEKKSKGDGFMKVSKDKTVVLDVANKLGVLNDVAQLLAKAKIDIQGVICLGFDDTGHIEMLLSDLTEGTSVLNGLIDVEVCHRDVLIASGEDTPGFMADVTKRLLGANVNIEFAMGSARGLVLGVNDLETAEAALLS